MTEKRLPSKFAFILHADIAGSTELVHRDEELAHKRIQDTFRRFGDIITQYHGQVRELRGDALLAEFERASDAVTAALVFQKGQSDYLSQIDDNILPAVRIGIALGEVIVADDTVTGGGVVLAQRVEQIAEPGGVCITGALQEALPQRLPFDQESLGEHQVKGFDKPVHVYRVQLIEGTALPEPIVETETRKVTTTQWLIAATVVFLICGGGLLAWFQPWKTDLDPASVERMAFPLPDKPSIAVLPFDNLSGDSEQDPIADGLSEDIIYTLSRVPDMFVIARNSTFTYKGKPVKVQQVAEDLGVHYVLEGSVQRSGDRLRITAQLIDALNGSHLWANRYDRPAENLFDVQDEITRDVLTELRVKLTTGESARVTSRGTNSLEAWLLRIQGHVEVSKYTQEGMLRARELYQKATTIDPGYARAWAGMAFTYAYEGRVGGWNLTRDEALRKALEFAEEAVDVDPEEMGGFAVLANVSLLKRDNDRGVELIRHAADLAPNDILAIAPLGFHLVWADEPRQALNMFARAKRLSPRYPNWIPGMEGLAQHMLGLHDDAIVSLKEAIRRLPGPSYSYVRLISVYTDLDRLDEAEAVAADLLERHPDFSINEYLKTQPFKYPKREEWLRALLLKAGLPESSPLELPDKPSIAVLPFTNMSGDPEQGYFADGITEDIITELSRFKDFFVISRTSSFAYKDKNIKVQDIGRELGVRYLLEGSVRRSGKDLRITAQLIDAQTGNHIWAEKYDRQIDDVFTIQDEINGAIVTTLGETLWQAAARDVARKPTSSFEAYDFLFKANEALHHLTKEDNLKARNLYEKALEFDIDFAAPYRGLAWTYLLDFITQWVTAGEEALDRAFEYTHKAITLESDSAGAHRLLARISQARGNYDEAIAQFERALELNPNDGDILASYGGALIYSGRSAEGIKWAKEAIRRNPHHPDWYTNIIAFGHYFNGEYGDTLKLLNRIERPRMWDHRLFAAAYAQTGNLTEAKKHVAAMLAINPETSISTIKPLAAFKNPADVDRYLEGLRKAGLPE